MHYLTLDSEKHVSVCAFTDSPFDPDIDLQPRPSSHLHCIYLSFTLAEFSLILEDLNVLPRGSPCSCGVWKVNACWSAIYRLQMWVNNSKIWNFKLGIAWQLRWDGSVSTSRVLQVGVGLIWGCAEALTNSQDWESHWNAQIRHQLPKCGYSANPLHVLREYQLEKAPQTPTAMLEEPPLTANLMAKSLTWQMGHTGLVSFCRGYEPATSWWKSEDQPVGYSGLGSYSLLWWKMRKKSHCVETQSSPRWGHIQGASSPSGYLNTHYDPPPRLIRRPPSAWAASVLQLICSHKWCEAFLILCFPEVELTFFCSCKEERKMFLLVLFVWLFVFF